MDESSIELAPIDTNRAVDYIMHTMAGYNVFGEMKTEFDEASGTIIDKVEGDIKIDRAALIFDYLMSSIMAVDKAPDGNYANRSGLSKHQIREFRRRMRGVNNEKHVQDLLDILQGNKEMPAMNNMSNLSRDFWLLIRAMQKLNYIAKEKQSIIADDNKMISKSVIQDKILEEINTINANREATLEKRFKNPVLV